MINVGDFTIIYDEPYSCVKIEDGIAYLKKAAENKGRHLQMAVELVPYFNDGELIKPEPPKREKSIRGLKIEVAKIIREETGMPVSRILVKFVHEHITDLIMELADIAAYNAKLKNHKTLRPAHWYHLQLGPGVGRGFYQKDLDEYAEDL